MNANFMNYFIKTKCGLEIYDLLKSRKGILAKLRFYWFGFFASLRDFGHKKRAEKTQVKAE